jgi:hypothetical protein
MEQKNKTKQSNDIVKRNLNIPMILLLFSQFFSAYFASVMKYNVNLLFSPNKWEKFDFLFGFIKLESYYYWNWLTSFSSLMLIFYILGILAKVSVSFHRQQLKSKITDDLIDSSSLEDSQWIVDYSVTISDFLSVFASIFFSLIIESWSVIRVNLTRCIKGQTFLGFVVCLFLLLLVNLSLRLLSKHVLSTMSKTKDDSLLSHFYLTLKDSYFFEIGNLFLILYYLFVPKRKISDPKEAIREVILVILFSYNVSSIINKINNLVKIIPKAKDNYNLWKKTNSLCLK